jgi:Hypoxia induced protein conserved region
VWATALRGGAILPRDAYDFVMKIFLTVLVVLLMFGTLAVLIAGMVGLVRGGGDPRRSNQLMRWRVILQGAALILFAILMSLLKS